MVELVGLLLMLLTVLVVALPLLSFLRMVRLTQEVEELRARVLALEQQSWAPAEPAAAAAPAQPAAAPVVPPPLPDDALTEAEFPASPPPPVAAPPARIPTGDLEERLGQRGLLYVGVLVLLFGVGFFLKYAVDNAWINETGRVVLGAIAGLALIAGGHRFADRGLAVFGQALTGTGLAVLYLAIFAALAFYELIGPATAFILMIAVTLAAGALAHRQASQPLAFIAVGGGFLTPFLVGGDGNAQLTLFSYAAVLVALTLALSLRHQWLALNAVSYVMTCITVMAWAASYYTEAQWLRTLLFLTLFAVLFLIILRETRRASGTTARVVSALLASAPVLYHIAAVVITASHPPAIHLYLIAFTVVGLLLTAEPHRPWLRLAILFAGYAPLFGPDTLPAGISWIVPNLVTIVAVALLHVLALIDRVRQDETLDTPDFVTLHLAGLGLYSLLYGTLEPSYPAARGAIGALLALGAVALWQWLQPRDAIAGLHAAGLAFALTALAIAVQLDGNAVVVGWAAEGTVAVWLGLRAGNRPFLAGGLVLFSLATLRLLDGYFTTPASFTAIVNARALTTALVVGLGYAAAWAFQRYPIDWSARARAALHVACSVVTLLWITAEIRSFWTVRALTTQAFLYEQMMLSLAWGLYGAALIALGMWRAYAVARYIGMTVIGITALKVFFFDLWELGGIYRVIGFIGFGVLLVLVSYLYQQRRTATPRATGATDPAGDAARP